jgi:hypothetical protein
MVFLDCFSQYCCGTLHVGQKNTALICLNKISWATTFDAFEVNFGHMKNDQSGADAKYSCHVYANFANPVICPVLAMGLYFTCCFNTTQTMDGPLFPGKDQHQRYSAMLHRLLHQHRDKVKAFGFDPEDLGTHSIRKGAISYLSSLVGGPPAAAVCIRAGWTMGKIRDVYMQYVASGDQYAGRSLCLLPIMLPEFGASPPFFPLDFQVWGTSLLPRQFPMLSQVVHLQRLMLMSLASILYHRRFLESSNSNHIVRVTSAVLHDEQVAMRFSEGNSAPVTVTFPWTDNIHAFTGIPPHSCILQ